MQVIKAVWLLSALPLSSFDATFHRRKVLSLLLRRLSHPGTRRQAAPSWCGPAGCLRVHAPLAHARATVASCELQAVGAELCTRDGINVTGQAACAARHVGNAKDALRLKFVWRRHTVTQFTSQVEARHTSITRHISHNNVCVPSVRMAAQHFRSTIRLWTTHVKCSTPLFFDAHFVHQYWHCQRL